MGSLGKGRGMAGSTAGRCVEKPGKEMARGGTAARSVVRGGKKCSYIKIISHNAVREMIRRLTGCRRSVLTSGI